jgi:O-antigen/teichoic acid export membrane protein
MRRHLKRGLRALRGNASILINSSLLASGSVLAALLGFVYWWCAAREFPPSAVGAQSVLISTMALVGMLGDAGFSTLLLGEAAGRGHSAHSLFAAATLAGAGITSFLAVVAAGALRYEHLMTGLDSLLFVIGCALTGFAFVLDCGFIGLGQSRLQFARSLMFSILKLILLVAVGLLTKASSAILLTWVASLAVTLALSCGHAWARGILRLVKPDLAGLMKESSVVITHHLLNLSAAAPPLILPLVVSSCVGTAVNAAFYVGWMVRALIMMVTGSMTVVLFSLDTSAAPDVMRQKMRFSLTLSLVISVLGLLGFVLFGDLLLRIFNQIYPSLAGVAMPMLGISLIGGTFRQHYVLLARVRRRMMTGSVWLTLGGFIEIVLATLGGLSGDVRSLALWWVMGFSVTAAFLAYPLFAYVVATDSTRLTGAGTEQPAHAAAPTSRRHRRSWSQRWQ